MDSAIHGLVVLDKPAGMTSRAAVDAAQRWFPRGTRIGHTGTLDPLATGVLVLCLGAATRLAEYVQAMSKTYHGGLLLGAHSDTDDADGTVVATPRVEAPTRQSIEKALAGFVGEIEQVPPQFSAAKVTGKRAYDLARQGIAVELRPRRVRIDAIEILEYAYPRVLLEVRCGKGTYIRSLARDLGDILGCGGLVAMLRRTRVGPFRAENGLSVTATTPEQARAKVLPLALAVAELPSLKISSQLAANLRQGKAIDLPAGERFVEGPVALFAGADHLVGVGLASPGTGVVKPDKILPAMG